MDSRLVTCVHNTGRQYEAGEDPHPGCAADDSAVAARRASVYISCCGGAGVRVVQPRRPSSVLTSQGPTFTMSPACTTARVSPSILW